MDTSPESLSGVVERITFHNLDNGYVVLRVRAPRHRDVVTVVGTLSSAVAGEYIEARGSWVNDKTHGPQFKADELRTTPPHTVEGIVKYLGSGLIKGIGPTYAKRIVEVFGERTLDVIDQSPTFLSDVKGIGPQRLERIRRSWQEQRGVREIMVFLQSYGVGTARAVRIYKQYGENAIELVKSNPYRLATDIWGVGFKTADELATRLGLPKDSPLRARAAIRYVLKDMSAKGHVGFPEHGVVDETMRLTSISPEIVREAIETGRTEDEFVRDAAPETPQGPAADWLYLKPLFLAEVGVARAVKALAQGDHPLPEINFEQALGWVQSRIGLEFAPSQRAAIEAATTAKVLVITGGPGVGKTTIVRGLIEIFMAKRLRIALAAPTGRAAKRLAESTGLEARTIHRLLEFDPGLGRFKRDRENPLEADLLVIDEASMVDLVLMNQLLRAVPAWCSLVLVGDVDQLPSVGAGTVLRDLIESNAVRVVRLTEIFRQAGASYIVRAAHAINAGLEPSSAPGPTGDFFFIEAGTPEKIMDRLIAVVRDRIPERFGLDPFRDVQVLSPMNKGELGVATLNQRLQEVLNGSATGKTVERFGRTYRVGDKVIQSRNDYQKEVFNGDIGRVKEIDSTDQVLTVEFDGRPVVYEFDELDELNHAFACSIHKSQGSEYPAVVIPLHTQHYVMLQRNLLYTGVTRGKKVVVLVGSRKALAIAVQRQDTAFRYSMLRERLRSNDAAPPR